jgi:group I intron endonuclease
MASGIYKITNLTNQRLYVGSSVNTNKRWNVHLYRLRKGTHHNQFLLADFRKCGESSFSFETIEKCSIEQLVAKEQALLDMVYDKQKKCYNLRPIAESNYGRKASNETKLKMSIAHKGRKPALQTIKASIERTKGKTLEEIYGFEKAINMKKIMSKYQQNRPSKHKQKLSEGAKNKWQNSVYREKMSKAHQKPCLKRRKQIIQFTLDNKKVGVYLGAVEASKMTGVNAGTIRQVALGTKKTAGGFLWKYEK